MKKVVLNYLVIAALMVSAAFTSCDDETKSQEFTVTFESNGGSSVETKTVKEGEKVKKPTDPTREGYAFVAWFKETTLSTEWKFDTDIVTADMTLYAKWEQNNMYTVTFNSNDGSVVTPQTVVEGGKATEPSPAPTKEGYTFDGWYSDNNTFSNKWNFASNTVTGDVTLYAKWIEDDNDVVKLLETITYDDGSYIKYDYNNQNHITKISWSNDDGTAISTTQTYSYSGNDLIKVVYEESDGFVGTFEYTKNENKIIEKYYDSEGGIDDAEIRTIELNSDGFPTKKIMYESEDGSLVYTYQYQDGNITNHSYKEISGDETDEGSIDCIYDSNKSPLYYCETPKWYLYWYHLDGSYISVKNNIIERFRDGDTGGKQFFTYDFDSEGYPTKMTVIYEYVDEDWSVTFTYISK